MKSLIYFSAIFFALDFAGAQTVENVPAGAPLTDAQIVQYVKTAHEGEVDAAKHAKSNAQNAQVKKFAEEMITGHKAAEDDLKKVSKNAKLKEEKSQETDALKASAKDELKKLKDTKKAEYDKAYINSQVAMHQSVLNALDTRLIPNAKNPELKTYLETTRNSVAKHLDDAKSLQTSL